MKNIGSKLLVVDTKLFGDVVVDEITSGKYRNKGTVIEKAEDISSIKKGDIVFFSDMSGVHVDKSNSPNIIMLCEEEVLFISDEDHIYTGEEYEFEISNEIDPNDNVCII